MTIEQLNKEMVNEINRLPEGEMGEVSGMMTFLWTFRSSMSFWSRRTMLGDWQQRIYPTSPPMVQSKCRIWVRVGFVSTVFQ